MISPPRRGDQYPGRLPPVTVQWSGLSAVTRAASILLPLAVILLSLAVDIRIGVTIAVLWLGTAAASAVYVKNRTDRHNAAIESGDIAVIADPHFRPAGPEDVPAQLLARADDLGDEPGGVGRVVRFDGGWIVRRRNPRDVAVVIGDDGGWARFDPRTVTDLWAVGEFLAGRGRDG